MAAISLLGSRPFNEWYFMQGTVMAKSDQAGEDFLARSDRWAGSRSYFVELIQIFQNRMKPHWNIWQYRFRLAGMTVLEECSLATFSASILAPLKRN